MIEVIDYFRLKWQYEEVEILITIEKKQYLTGKVEIIIFAMKISVLQYLIVNRVEKIINNGREKAKKIVIFLCFLFSFISLHCRFPSQQCLKGLKSFRCFVVFIAPN